MTDDSPTTHHLLGDLDTFLADHWEQAPFFGKGVHSGEIFGPAEVDDLLRSGTLTSPASVDVYSGGRRIDEEFYTEGTSGLEPDYGDRRSGVVVPALVHELVSDGATVILRRLEQHVPAIQALCQELSNIVGHGLKANAYVTPPHNSGLALHYDPRDIFVVQTWGAKEWQLFAPEVIAPIPTHRPQVSGDEPTTPDATFTMEKGDLMYFPRGWRHTVRTTHQPSIHLTMSVRAVTRWHVTERVLQNLVEQPTFRKALPPEFGRDAPTTETEIAEIRSLLSDYISDVPADAFRRAAASLHAGATAPELGRTFAETMGDGETTQPPLWPGQLLELADDAVVTTTDEGVEVSTPTSTNSASLPAAFEAGLRKALTEPVRLDNIAPQLPAPLVRRLVEKLIAAGLLHLTAAD